MTQPGTSQRLTWVRNGQEKTRLLFKLAVDDALDARVRDAATRIAASTRSDIERIRRLHRFVRDSVPYFREPIEMFAPAWFTMRHGGDCDDHVRLLLALAWSLRYPIAVEAIGDPAQPAHYTARVGFPAHDSPAGDSHTRWIPCETTIPAMFGEHVSDAVRRMP